VRRPADDAPFEDREVESLFSDLSAGALLAVSGGSDSTALLWLAHRYRAFNKDCGFVVATVDHGLRPEGSTEAQVVARLAARWGFAHVTLVWEGPKPATGVQAAAREARYRLLAREAKRRQLPLVVTAHTLEDQAETVLMRFIAGSGVKGLAGMAMSSERDGVQLLRPLLWESRARLRGELVRNGLAWIEDPSNEDVRFLRPRLRRLMPLLAAEGLDVGRLVAIAGKMARADAALDSDTHDFLCKNVAGWRPYEPLPSGGEIVLAPERFGPPEEVMARALALCIHRAGGTKPGDDQIAELLTDISLARMAGERLRRTLGGALIEADAKRIRIAAEPPRRPRP
jgi:tRNA(Ile)-lysidine synthase